LKSKSKCLCLDLRSSALIGGSLFSASLTVQLPTPATFDPKPVRTRVSVRYGLGLNFRIRRMLSYLSPTDFPFGTGFAI
jgi:hypothetical protein